MAGALSNGLLDLKRGAMERAGASVAVSAARLAALWAFAVLQPVLSVLDSNGDLFIGRQISGWPLVAVLLAFALLPPVVLALLEWLAGRAGAGARAVVHLLFVWSLLSLLALYVLMQISEGAGLGALPVAVAVAACGLVLYVRFEPVGGFLAVLGPAPALFVLYFLLFSPSHSLIFPADADVAVDHEGAPPVVMVMLDELPIGSLMDERGRVDAKLFPNFARLARGSTWYRNATASADFTEQAVPALLTGRRPRPGTLPVARDHAENLFTMLASSHRLEVMEHITWLCPPSHCPNRIPTLRRMKNLASALSVVYGHVVAPGPLKRRLPLIGSTWAESRSAKDPRHVVQTDAPAAELARHGDRQFERFLDSLGRPRDGGRPGLHFLHSSLPHVPWKHTPSGRRYTGHFESLPGLYEDGHVWDPDPHLVSLGLQRHLLQASFVDRLIGRLLERLRKVGLLDRALVVVTADHGASFQPGRDRRFVTRSNAGEVGLVPLFVRAPGQRRGRIDDAHLQTIDVVPLVARELGLEVPWRVDGKAPSQLPAGGRRRLQIFRHAEDGGSSRHFAPSLVEAHRRRSIRRKLSLFGSGSGHAGLFGIGPDRDLVGKRVSQLRPARGAGRATIYRREEFRDVDRRSLFVPALVEGVVEPRAERVLIAVNGRVEGAAPTYRDAGTRRFSVMIPEGSLRRGRNEVEVIAATGQGPDRRLVRVEPDDGESGAGATSVTMLRGRAAPR